MQSPLIGRVFQAGARPSILGFGSQVVTESLSRRSLHDLDGRDRVNLPSGCSPIALATRCSVLRFILVLHVERSLSRNARVDQSTP